MPLLAAWAVLTPAGDARATLDALANNRLDPGRLEGPLLPLLIRLGRTALAGTTPDLVLLATAKGDLPLWTDSLFADPPSEAGGPAWLAQGLAREFACPAWTVSAACASGPVALAEAARCLRSGSHRRILVLGGERLAPFVTEGFAGLKAIDPNGCHPFAARRAGTVLSETAAAIVLVPGDATDGLPMLQGWGHSLDAHHLTGPCRDGAGLVRACSAAAEIAGNPQPGLVIAHGTATRANDEAEAAAYAAWCPGVPVTAWKGGLGHSLGACGLTEAALAAEAWMAGGMIPGTRGNPQVGTSAGIPVLGEGWHRPPGPWLSTNAGFGGINGAIILGDRPPRPPTTRVSACVARCQLEADGNRRIPRPTARQVLGRVDASWGRMDAASRALVALGHQLGSWSPGAGLVLVTTQGCRDTDQTFEGGRRRGEPDWQVFAYTLPSTPLGEGSIRLGICGPGLALVGADADAARATARRLIDEGVPEVLVAGIETGPLATPESTWAERWRPTDF